MEEERDRGTMAGEGSGSDAVVIVGSGWSMGKALYSTLKFVDGEMLSLEIRPLVRGGDGDCSTAASRSSTKVKEDCTQYSLGPQYCRGQETHADWSEAG